MTGTVATTVVRPDEFTIEELEQVLKDLDAQMITSVDKSMTVTLCGSGTNKMSLRVCASQGHGTNFRLVD